jgi:hypothetical protein
VSAVVVQVPGSVLGLPLCWRVGAGGSWGSPGEPLAASPGPVLITLELEAMTPGILEWARSIGCTHASLVGREGWRRVPWMLADGWRFKHVVLEKEL